MGNIFTPEFITMLSGLLVAILIGLIPQLDSIKTELVTVVTVLVGLVVASLGGERIAAARASGSTKAERLSVQSVANSKYAAPLVKREPPPVPPPAPN